MFENRKPLMYVKPTKEGKMFVDMGKNEDGTRKIVSYDYVTGKVLSINLAESTYNNEIIKSWKIKLQDSDNEAVLTVGHSSGFTRGLMNSLANADFTRPIKFGCYVKNEYLQPSLYQNGQLLKWKYEEMPKSDKVKVGSKDVYDDTLVIAWLEKLVAEINEKINAAPKEATQVEAAQEVFTPADLDSLPF
jgi:predicted transcriptional regulator